MTNILIIIGVVSVMLYVIGINIVMHRHAKKKLPANSKRSWFVLLSILLTTVICIAAAMSGLLTLVFYGLVIILGIAVTVRNRKVLTLAHYAIGLGAAILVVITMAPNSTFFTVLNGLSTFVAFLGGISLVKVHQLNTYGGKPRRILRNILIGGAIAIPPAILNATATFDDSHIQTIWHSLLAIKPAVHEELLVRFLLMTYILTRRSRPNIFVANLLVSIPFALLHGFNPVGNLIVIVLFSLPLGYICTLFGIEAAISAHFVTDFIRYLSPFI